MANQYTVSEYGNPAAIYARANELSQAAGLISASAAQLNSTGQAVGAAGQNSYTSMFSALLMQAKSDLATIGAIVGEAPNILRGLASDLDDQARKAAHPSLGFGGSGIQAESPLFEALHRRHQAASQLDGLTQKFDAQVKHGPNFLKDVWDNTGGAIVHGAVSLWGLTGEGLLDAKAAGQHWKNLGSGIENFVKQLVDHPGSTSHALFDGLTGNQLRHSDTPAWFVTELFNIGSFAVGVGEIRVATATKLSDLARLGKAGELSETSAVLLKYAALEKVTVVLQNYSNALGKWDALNHFKRGYNVEDVLAFERQQSEAGTRVATIHLVSNHPVIDLWNAGLGKITSVKSIDPALPTYAENPSKFVNQLKGYEQSLKDYAPDMLDGVRIGPRTVQTRELLLGLPDSGLSDAQAAALSEFVESSAKDGITVTITEIPR